MTTSRSISLTVDLNDDTDVMRVVEVLARAAGGLLLDGIESRIYGHQYDDAELDTE